MSGRFRNERVDLANTILSNNHVLANVNEGSPGDEILEPAPADGGMDPPISAALFQSVRKHGRTSRHTVGIVTDLSADVWVRVGARAMAWFEGQFEVVGAGGDFSRPGDSGSLVVDGVSRRAVGLLFAGGSGHTFVNPIQPVLDRFDAEIVGA